MPITANDIRWRRSEINNDTTANGGRMTSIEIPTGVKNNIFGDVPKSERQAGSVKYRKVFIDVGNLDNLAMLEPIIFVHQPTLGDDGVHILPATFTDTQADIDASYKEHAAAFLSLATEVGATQLNALLDVEGTQPFVFGDSIRISNQQEVDGSGLEHFAEITNVTYTGDSVTIEFAPPSPSAFNAIETRVANTIKAADVKPQLVNLNIASTAGDFNQELAAVMGYGARQETISFVFSTPTSYTATGSITGEIGNGTTGARFRPLNPTTSTERFDIPVACWSGTFVAGDTVSFDILPAAIPLWYKRIVPEGATEIAGNSVVIGIAGESY